MSTKARQFSLAHALNQILHFVFPVVLIAVVANTAFAQVPTLREGQKLRIKTSSTTVTGTVKSLSDDSVRLFTDAAGSSVSIRRSEILRAEASQGKSALSGMKRGAMWGAGVGAVLAAVVYSSGKATQKDDSYYNPPTDSEINSVTSSMFLGSILWGLGIGAFLKRESWQDVPIRGQMAASTAGVGLRLNFTSALLH